MKRQTWLSVIVLLSMILIPLASPLAAQDTVTPADTGRVPRPAPAAGVAAAPEWGGTWQFGPDTAFSFTRLDAGYYPGDGKVYFMGGRLAAGDTDGSVWSFDPVAGTYADTGVDLVTPISNYTMNLLQDGAGDWGFYVLGGRPSDGSVNHTVQVYYPESNTAVQLDPADNYPGSVSCTSGLNAVYENKAYVAGGFDATANHGETWVFDPIAAVGSKWTQIPSATLSLARAYIMSAVVDGKIYAIGGNWFDGSALINVATVEVMDPSDPSPTWTGVADMPEVCSSSRAYGFNSGSPYLDPDGTPMGGKIVSGCGVWSDENEHVYAYDSGADAWEDFPWLNVDRRDHAGEFLPTGGGDGMPGMWVWGGRKDSDANVLISSEYYGLVGGAQECTILLVDDDWDFGDPNGGGRPYYTSALDDLGIPYTVWDTVTQGDPGLADMASYSVVVWFTGYAWQSGVFTPQNEAAVAAYLDLGGNFLLSAQEYMYEAGAITPFMQNYLGIQSIIEDMDSRVMVGVDGNVIGDGLGPYNLVRPDDWGIYWPMPPNEGLYDDEVYAHPGAEEPFHYGDPEATSATNYDGGAFKSVYLGWPFEWLEEAGRAPVMGAALDWLCPSGGAGVSLLPPYQEDSGGAGEVIDYALDLVNLTGLEETFDIDLGGNLWDASAPATVGPVGNGESISFTVSVTIPLDVVFPDEDMAVITATSQSDAGVYGTARIRTYTMATIDGHIYDANTGEPLAGFVTVYDTDDRSVWYEAFADENGYYYITDPTLVQGEYDIYGAMIGWFRVDDTVVLAGDQFNTVDFHLPAPIMSVVPGELDVTVPPSETRQVGLWLNNAGTGDLLYRIDEIAPESGFMPLGVEPSRSAGVDPQVYADLAASPDGMTTFLVYLTEQADLSAAFQIDDWSERGQYVLDALRSTAESTQAGLRSQLDRAGFAYESRYIVNALVVEANLAAVESIAALPEVAYIGPNSAIPAPEPVEMDPGVDGTDEVEWNIAKVGADEVWSAFGVTGTGIIVSNIDTGVLYNHPALVNQYRGNLGGTFDHAYNWWDPYGYGPTEPYDFHSHGSHTMGTMLGDDGAGNQIGMAPGATWFACQGFDQVTGSGYTAELLECAEFVLAPWDLDMENPDPDLRPHVVNNSWGGGPNDGWYFNTIAAWRAAGIFPAFSAGNAGPECSTVNSPSDYYNAFATGAVNSDDLIATFSSRGPSALGVMKPQVTAPGVNVRSAVNTGGYGLMGGTSMASPHSAGEVALIWSAQPELIGNVQVTEWLMQQTAEPILDDQCGDPGPPNYVYGWGRIDAYNAVSTALTTEWDVDWLSVSPAMGSVAPGEQARIAVTLDATGLIEGCFTATLKLETNDPYLGLDTFVPVQMCVGELMIYLPILLK